MWILQEYRFYLIIAVIALAAIILLFFRTQTSQQYVDFNTQLKADYAQVKWAAGDTKTFADVILIDDKLRALEWGQLFGLTWDENLNGWSTIIVDKSKMNMSCINTLNGSESRFGMIFVQEGLQDEIDPVTSSTNVDISGGCGVDDTSIKLAKLPVNKGWNLDSTGEILFYFANEEVAKKVMVDYLPEGTLVSLDDGSGMFEDYGVLVPFIQ